MYLASAQVNTITLLNHFDILVLYNIFIRKLKNITIFSIAFIKKQISNNRLIGMWNNFKYKKNVASKKIENIMKFKFITMVL